MTPSLEGWPTKAKEAPTSKWHPSSTCKIDGTWQKRGHSPANGVVTVTVGNKCEDTHVLSKHCKQCQIWEIRQGTTEYSNWKDSHVCSVNHTASLGAMEAEGPYRYFEDLLKKTISYITNIWEMVAYLLSKLLLTPSHRKNTILPQQSWNVLPMCRKGWGHVCETK